MIVKNSLSKMRKVEIAVSGLSGQKFANGNRSVHLRVYDTTPEEVVKLIEKALEAESD